jgi:hypothetical protein
MQADGARRRLSTTASAGPDGAAPDGTEPAGDVEVREVRLAAALTT